MSTEFIDVFFPLSGYLLRNRHPERFEHFFPSGVQYACPKPMLRVPLDAHGQYLPIWWPSLVPITLLGFAIGLYGHLELLAVARRRKLPTPTSWALAMAFYAMMNMAAIACHCLVYRTSPWKGPLVSLDVAATACCGIAASYGAFTDELSYGGSSKARSRSQRMTDMVLASGLINSSAFFGSQLPFMNELLYIGMSVLAGIVVGSYVVRRPKVGRQRLWVRMLFFGAVVALSGIPLDRHLCRWIGPHVNHVTLLFAGCHIIMLSVLLYVREDLITRPAGAIALSAAASTQDTACNGALCLATAAEGTAVVAEAVGGAVDQQELTAAGSRGLGSPNKKRN